MMRRTIGGGLVAIAVVIAFGGVFSYRSTRRFIDRAARAPGTVVRVLEEVDAGDGGKSYYPVVQFRAPAGAPVEFRSHFGSNPAGYRPGDPVTVLYEPDAPDRAEIADFWPLWSLTLMCGLLGTIFLGAGVGVLVAAPRAVPQYDASEAEPRV
jgi:hypothetical protein